MTRTTSRLAALLAAAALALGGCAGSTTPGSDGDSGGSEASEPAPAESTPADDGEAGGSADLMVADSSLGEVVVDSEGMTVYVFDNDTQGSGESSCEGPCLVNWPPVAPAAEEPTGDGVTGELGTITATDGSIQITLDGWPLYYFKGDSAPGDVNGQAAQDVWWVVSPTGEAIR